MLMSLHIIGFVNFHVYMVKFVGIKVCSDKSKKVSVLPPHWCIYLPMCKCLQVLVKHPANIFRSPYFSVRPSIILRGQ